MSKLIKNIMQLMRFNIIILLIFTCSCQRVKHDNSSAIAQLEDVYSDTIIGSKTITEELAGSLYRKRAKGYFTIIGNDTSEFICYVTESKSDGIDISIKTVNSIVFREHMLDLEKIFPVASSDFDFRTLNSIGVGRFVTLGDLAVKVTNEYIEKYGNKFSVDNYKEMSSFLLSSSFAKEFNRLLEPFSTEVDTVYIEKCFFADKESLLRMCKIEIDSAQIPDKIIDCITWLSLRKKSLKNF